MAKKKIGEILIDNNVINGDTLDQALLKQKDIRKPIGQILEDMDAILEEDIAQGLSLQFNIPYLKNFARHEVAPEVLTMIDAGYALAKLIFPLKIEQKTLSLAMANPLDMELQSELEFRLGMRISTFITTPEEIKTAIKKHYGTQPQQKTADNTLSVLHVDQQDLVLRDCHRIFEQHGIKGYQARDGAEGLKLAVKLLPHLIITDIALPRIDGKQMFTALQDQPETRQIPVIALSSNTSTKEEYQLLEMGFFDFMAKPFDPYRFLARIKRAIRQTSHIELR